MSNYIHVKQQDMIDYSSMPKLQRRLSETVKLKAWVSNYSPWETMAVIGTFPCIPVIFVVENINAYFVTTARKRIYTNLRTITAIANLQLTNST